TVTVRRTVSLDAHEINSLISSATVPVFGRVNVIHLLVEDHDNLTHIFTEQTKVLTGSYGPYFLAELIEAQDEENHSAVCKNEGTAVGFISVSGDINLKLLKECFELGPFNRLYQPSPEDLIETAPEPKV
uniref:Cilia- and flagella-associated protein 61 N-terminal domain-containing protein n=1 Tax=Oncorhynchus tshawytscha TaxID=74940 RepID=A0AAZ3STH0_ONCTS